MAAQGWRKRGGGASSPLPLASGSVPASWTTQDKAFISFWKGRQALPHLSLSPLPSAPYPIHRVDQPAMANLPLPKTEHYLESFLAEEAAGDRVGSRLLVGSEQDFLLQKSAGLLSQLHQGGRIARFQSQPGKQNEVKACLDSPMRLYLQIKSKESSEDIALGWNASERAQSPVPSPASPEFRKDIKIR